MRVMPRKGQHTLPADCGDGVARASGRFQIGFPIEDNSVSDLGLAIEAMAEIRDLTREVAIVFDWRDDWFTRTKHRVLADVPFLSPWLGPWLERAWFEHTPNDTSPYTFDNPTE